MKRIGILTFWGVPNYGAFAQAYALNKVISDLMPEDDVEHIAYLHPRHYALYFLKRQPRITSFRSLISLGFYKECFGYAINKKIEYPSFQKDWDSIVNRRFDSSEELETFDYDIIVTGSDAIWEFSVPEFGNDIHLIGNNLRAGKLISYAASFGDMNVGDSFEEFVVEGLKHYDLIAVRDETSREIIKNLTDIQDITLVLDPTLLHDFKNDTEIPKSMYKRYVLVYGNDFSGEIISDVKEHAKRNGFTIIGAGIAPEWCDIRLTDISPKEWIGLFRDAEYVVTCTFHGLMFSINYEKKVVFNQIEYVKNRSTYLLESLGIYDLYRNGADVKEILGNTWDYNMINSRLDEMRKISFEFLKRGLKYE